MIFTQIKNKNYENENSFIKSPPLRNRYFAVQHFHEYSSICKIPLRQYHKIIHACQCTKFSPLVDKIVIQNMVTFNQRLAQSKFEKKNVKRQLTAGVPEYSTLNAHK